jgi:hypothetical protein
MARLWIGNIAPGTPDEEVKALLVKYGFPEFDGIEQVTGDGSRPAVMLTFEGADARSLEQLSKRMHNLYWKERRLSVMVMSGSRWDA